MKRREVAGCLLGALPERALQERDPEAYWLRVRREQFLLPDWRAFMNNGSLGVAPRPVLRAVSGFLEASAGLASDEYPRWGYETLDAQRSEVAAFAGCSKEELAFTHNATEAISIVAEGLDLKEGDEVVITDQEHPSGRCPWLRRRERDRIAVREAKLPLPPRSAAQLAEAVVAALGPRTRVLSFSGILTGSGVIMPVRTICEAARAKGIRTLVDGAHMNGQMPFRIDELGCDFFAGSPHKWMFAPAGCGLLYIRADQLDRLWPTVVTGAWDDRRLGAARFMQVGTNNRAIFEGLIAGLRFLKQLGPEAVYARIHHLARTVYAEARKRNLDLLSAEDHTLYAALVAFRLKKDVTERFDALCRKKRIWTSLGDRCRVSTHIHTRLSDIELFFSTLDEAMLDRGRAGV